MSKRSLAQEALELSHKRSQRALISAPNTHNRYDHLSPPDDDPDHEYEAIADPFFNTVANPNPNPNANPNPNPDPNRNRNPIPDPNPNRNPIPIPNPVPNPNPTQPVIANPNPNPNP